MVDTKEVVKQLVQLETNKEILEFVKNLKEQTKSATIITSKETIVLRNIACEQVETIE